VIIKGSHIRNDPWSRRRVRLCIFAGPLSRSPLWTPRRDGGDADPGLLKALSAIADPRKSRGVRHRPISKLALCTCAVLAGAKSFIAIAEWAMDLTPLLRAKLGVGRVPPYESTIRRVRQRVAPDVLDEAVSAWLAARSPTRTRRSVFALDDKTSRGAR